MFRPENNLLLKYKCCSAEIGNVIQEKNEFQSVGWISEMVWKRYQKIFLKQYVGEEGLF